MKTLAQILVITSLLTAASFSQIKRIEDRGKFLQGDIEVTSSSIMGISRTTGETTFSGITSEFSGENEFFWEIGLAIGVYVIDGLSVEPEFNINFIESETAFSIIGNVLYTFHIPRKTIYPFLKAGYGVSSLNSRSSYNYFGERSEGLFESLNGNVFCGGFGLKIIYSQTTVMRIELNYKYFTNEFSEQDFFNNETQTYKYATSALSIVFGFAILF